MTPFADRLAEALRALLRDAEIYRGNGADIRAEAVLKEYDAAERWDPTRDEPQAMAEGWCVFDVDREYAALEIQKVDEMEKWDSDDAALGHVFESAMKGSPLHWRAIRAVLESRR